MDLYLVGCSKRKRAHPCPAADMYVGPLFRAAWRYAEGRGRRMILSARYGLLDPATVIEPYDARVCTDDDSRRLAAMVVPAVLKLRPQQVTLLAPEVYCRHIERHLIMAGFPVRVPLQGLKQGQRLRWLVTHAGQAPTYAPPGERAV